MSIWTELARAGLPAGDEILLRQKGAIYEIRFNGFELMANVNHRSETVLAERTLRLHDSASAKILIGGLGMGFTLAAALAMLDAEAEVTVCEIVPEIVAWNREHIGHLAGHPLRDPRVRTLVADVSDVLAAHEAAWDVILMDTDNGPDIAVRAENEGIYAGGGLTAVRRALHPGGIASFWSATASESFERTLDAQPWSWRRDDIQLVGGRADAFHHIYFASENAARIGLRDPALPELRRGTGSGRLPRDQARGRLPAAAPGASARRAAPKAPSRA